MLAAIARTLWLCAYADAIENNEIEGPRPGGGEDWDDYAPATPPEAEAKARKIIRRIGHDRVHMLANRWMADTGHDVERFGHCFALQALGHGVGLQDDYPCVWRAPKVDFPYVEFNIFEVDLSAIDDITVTE